MGDVFPEAAFEPSASFFSVFSIALAAATFAPASAVAGVSFFAGVEAAGVPIERTLAFGFGASPPMLRTFGAPSLTVTGLFRSPAEPSAGRFAIVGVCRGACCAAAGAACGCCW